MIYRTVSERDVVITGLGIVSPIGIGREAVWESLAAGRSGVHAIPELEAADWPAPFAGRVEDFDAKAWVHPRKSLKVMSREIQLACAAAAIAWEDAGLDAAAIDPERLGVICGAPGQLFCEPEELAASYRACQADPEYQVGDWPRQAINELFPLWMLKYLPNMPGCHIGIRYDARGPTNTICLNDVSSLLAIAEAADVIRRGAADVMLVGGTGSYLNATRLVWHAGAGLSHDGADPARACRPFDAARSGLVYGEGAALFVLESRQHAEQREANVMASVVAVSSRFEPAAGSHTPTGDAIRRALDAALHQAKLSPRDIGHVNAQGNSTKDGDAMEAQAIRQVLGDVPVTAPKSFFGNLGTGSGAVELAVSLVGMEHGVVPPTLNYETPDAACPVNVVREPIAAPSGSFVALNYNHSGQAAAAVFTAMSDEL